METNIKRGMRLYSLDGRLLGRVAGVNADGLRGMKGFLIRRHFQVRWGEIARSDGGSIVVCRRAHPLQLHPMDLERARIDDAKFEDRRLPDAQHPWRGKAMSALDQVRMEQLTGLGVATHEELPKPRRELEAADPPDPQPADLPDVH